MIDSPDPGPLERLIRRDRLVILIGLAVLCVLAWLYVASGAGMGLRVTQAGPQMGGMDMAGMAMAGGKAAPAPWSVGRWALVLGMWVSMMVAMMTPSAAPTVLLYGRVEQRAGVMGQGGKVAPTWAFLTGYLLAWAAFSGVAAGLQWGLEQAGLISVGGMSSESRQLSAAVLAAAGLYQLSPLQNACLTHCRSPLAFLIHHWRPGLTGAVRLGVMHGAYCVGCCWLLMALLFVGGVMNLLLIVALTMVILAEKVLPGGRKVATASGVLLLIGAAVTLLG